MKELTYNERIAVMRILKDIILADNRIDDREQLLFTEIAKTLDLDETAKQDVEKLNSLLALTIIHDFKQEQKEEDSNKKRKESQMRLLIFILRLFSLFWEDEGLHTDNSLF